MKRQYVPASSPPLNNNMDGLSEEVLRHYAKHYAIYGDSTEEEYYSLVQEMQRTYCSGTAIDLVDLFCSSIPFPAFPWVQDADQTFTAYLNFAANYFPGQVRAAEERMPNIPLFSLPKTASSFVNNTFANGLDIPYTMVSWYGIKTVNAWAECFVKGPGVLHDHLHAEAENGAIIKAAGFKKAVIHVRDPRQMLVSLAHHSQADGGYKRMDPKILGYNNTIVQDQTLEYTIDLILEDYQPLQCALWVEDWENLSPDIEVFVSRYEKLHADSKTFFNEILEFCDADDSVKSKLENFMEAQSKEDERAGYNFRSGRVDEWRDVLLPRHLSAIEQQLENTCLGEFYLR